MTAPGASKCTVSVTWGDVVYPAIVDPTWTTTTSMAAARANHTASQLQNGKVLVAGGGALVSELYDPITETWTVTGSTVVARANHTASVLSSGKVFVVGGYPGAVGVASAELLIRQVRGLPPETSQRCGIITRQPYSQTGLSSLQEDAIAR